MWPRQHKQGKQLRKIAIDNKLEYNKEDNKE
jgi:hypothetical protein